MVTRISADTKRRSRQLRREMTDAERRLWKHLRLRQIEGHRFRRQHPLGTYIADFVCLESKLIIEVDGGQHLRRAAYDLKRSLLLEGKGFRVIRFWNNEVLNNMDGVVEVIRRVLLNESRPPSPPSP